MSKNTPILPNVGNLGFGGSIFGGNSRSITPDNAMQLTTVFACNRVIAETLSSISLDIFKKIENGKEKDTTHTLYNLLKYSPNPYMTSVMWREMIATDLNLRGNHYSQIVRNGMGDVIALYPLVTKNMTVALKKGKKVFTYQNGDKKHKLSSFDVLHIQGLPSEDGITGLSPISANKRALELGSTAETFGSSFFNNGANASGAFSFPGVLSDKAFDRLKISINEANTGMINANKPMLLDEGMKFQRFTISNSDSQFLETRKYQKEEIASIFRVPMHMVNSLENATFSNIEHQSLEFVQFTMLPWIKRIEQALTLSLLSSDEMRTHSIKFNVDSLLRGDFATRTAGYATLFNIGVLSQNEIRAKENMNSIGKDGDKYFVQLNMAEAKENTKGDNK
jgi:HK97 family phage portal protein